MRKPDGIHKKKRNLNFDMMSAINLKIALHAYMNLDNYWIVSLH